MTQRKIQPAHGVMQGDNGQALVDAKSQGLVQAEASGHGQDYGPGAPRLAGTKANVKAIKLPGNYFAGKGLSADRNSPSAEKLKTCAQEKLEADIPATHFRHRAPRLATQERHKPPQPETGTVQDFPCDHKHEGYVCPKGQCVKLEARRHTMGNHLYRRYAAAGVDCDACPLRAKCLQNAQTRCKPLAGFGEPANETLAPQMLAKRDTPEARAIYGRRRAMVDPVFGHSRSHKRLDRFPLQGKSKVHMQWRLSCMVHNIEKSVHYGRAPCQERSERHRLHSGPPKSEAQEAGGTFKGSKNN
jgi:hypothetical protein